MLRLVGSERFAPAVSFLPPAAVVAWLGWSTATRHRFEFELHESPHPELLSWLPGAVALGVVGLLVLTALALALAAARPEPLATGTHRVAMRALGWLGPVLAFLPLTLGAASFAVLGDDYAHHGVREQAIGGLLVGAGFLACGVAVALFGRTVVLDPARRCIELRYGTPRALWVRRLPFDAIRELAVVAIRVRGATVWHVRVERRSGAPVSLLQQLRRDDAARECASIARAVGMPFHG